MIGLFDSGSGGLTVLSALLKRMPAADVVYFGDTKHAPYGERSRAELSRLTLAAIRFLHEKGATSVVSACNSVSASLVLSVFDALPYPPDRLIEMVGPTVAALRDSDKRILVLATPATIKSEIYQNAFKMVGKEVAACAVPDLAGAIERDEGGHEELIRRALGDLRPDDFDVVVLACTHYPLVIDAFRSIFKGAEVFDPAEAVAERVERAWWPREVGDGQLTFYISAEAEPFRKRVTELFPGRAYELQVLE